MLCFRFETSITGKSAETGAASASEVANALGRGARDGVNLPSVEAEPLICSTALRLDSARIRQEHSSEAALEYCRGDPALGHIGEALRRKHDGRVLAPKCLQPLPDL